MEQPKLVPRGVYPSSIPKWAPVRPIRDPFGAQLCPTGAQQGPTWNAAWVACSGPDQGQERARPGGRTLHKTEDRTLRLAEKASSCGQKMGHLGRIIGDGRGDDRCQKRRLEWRPGSQVPKSR